MASIFQIFSSHEHSVGVQKENSNSLHPGGLKGAVGLKERSKSDSSCIYGKKVLGDVRNTIKQSAKEPKVFGKTEQENTSVFKCIRTPMKSISETPLSVRTVQNTCKSNKTIDVPLNIPVHSEVVSIKQDDHFPLPEVQGDDPDTYDDYEDIWPKSERPTIEDFGRWINFWDGCKKQPLDFKCPSTIWSPEKEKDEYILDSGQSIPTSPFLIDVEIPPPEPVSLFFD